MKRKELISKIAKLETINDQLATEIQYLEYLTRALGFADGLATLKAAAIEMLETEDQRKKTKSSDGANPPLSN